MENPQNTIVKLSNIQEIDANHREAYLCSKDSLWNENGLTNETLPQKFRVIKCENYSFSGSGIFTQAQLQNTLNNLFIFHSNIQKVWIVDLMKEYHGFIKYNDNAIPFTFRAEYNTVNFGVKYDDVSVKQSEVLQSLNQHENYKNDIKIISKCSSEKSAVKDILQTVKIKSHGGILSEGDIVQQQKNVQYKHFPCADHSPPSYEAIVDFANFIHNEFDSSTDWIHIHCHGGKGRSTSFSLMLDMFMRLKNGNLSNTSFDGLLQFHKDSGGKDLSYTDDDSWKAGLANQRYALLKNIYDLLVRVEEMNMQNMYSEVLKICLLSNQKVFISPLNTTFNSFSSEINQNNEIQEKMIALHDEFYDIFHHDEVTIYAEN